MLMNVIRSKNISTRVIIQSFDFRTLQYLHQKYPAIQTAMLVEATEKNSLHELITQLGFRPTIFSPEVSLVTRELIKECHQLGIKIIPWTVNDLQKINTLIQEGVEGIITDYPNLFKEIR